MEVGNFTIKASAWYCKGPSIKTKLTVLIFIKHDNNESLNLWKCYQFNKTRLNILIFSDAGLKLEDPPSGSGTIWLEGLDCKAEHKSLFDCSHRGWGVHSCEHNQDAGVSCYNMGEIFKVHLSLIILYVYCTTLDSDMLIASKIVIITIISTF